MSKVYIVEYQRWEEHYISGVFTTEELAQKYIDDLPDYINRINFDIIEQELIGV
jgi:hypothetical protein